MDDGRLYTVQAQLSRLDERSQLGYKVMPTLSSCQSIRHGTNQNCMLNTWLALDHYYQPAWTRRACVAVVKYSSAMSYRCKRVASCAGFGLVQMRVTERDEVCRLRVGS